MNETFDYSLVDNETAEFLKEREYTINGIAEDARIKIGRELKKAQDKLANHHDGVFVKWYESGGLDKHQVYYYINLNQFSTNLENTQKDNFLNAPKSLQKEVMKKNTPEDLKQKVLDGDITTNKEYQQLQQEKSELEQEKSQLESQLEQAQRSESIARKQLEEAEDREPEIKTEYKEVIPENVKKKLEQIENNKKLLEQKDKENREIRKQLREQQEKLQEQKDTNDKEEYWDMLTDDQIISRQRVYAETNLLEVKEYTDEFLNKVSINAFRDAAIAKSSQRTKNMIYDSTEEVMRWAKSMQQKLNTNSFAEEASYREEV